MHLRYRRRETISHAARRYDIKKSRSLASIIRSSGACRPIRRSASSRRNLKSALVTHSRYVKTVAVAYRRDLSQNYPDPSSDCSFSSLTRCVLTFVDAVSRERARTHARVLYAFLWHTRHLAKVVCSRAYMRVYALQEKFLTRHRRRLSFGSSLLNFQIRSVSPPPPSRPANYAGV